MKGFEVGEQYQKLLKYACKWAPNVTMDSEEFSGESKLKWEMVAPFRKSKSVAFGDKTYMYRKFLIFHRSSI